MEVIPGRALGNQYLIMSGLSDSQPLTSRGIKNLCHDRCGVGSDGLLLGPLESDRAPFGLRIFNADGSEAERSGNGIRIFARHLYKSGLVSDNSPFELETLGGVVRCNVFEDGRMVEVDMGKVSFSGEPDQEISVKGETLLFNAASIGNPHCVMFFDEVSEELAREYGPHIETHPFFPNRTNVQFVRVAARNDLEVQIWERGSGYTLSSGSSSCAAAAVAHRLDLCDQDVTVHMPGGDLSIQVFDDFSVRMTGPVDDGVIFGGA